MRLRFSSSGQLTGVAPGWTLYFVDPEVSSGLICLLEQWLESGAGRVILCHVPTFAFADASSLSAAPSRRTTLSGRNRMRRFAS